MFGTKLHWITLLYLILEGTILIIQIAICLSRPKDIRRVRFFILLLLFILFNLSNGFIPPSISVLSKPMLTQIIITYAIGIALGTYYFYYLVKEFNIQTDRYYNPKILISSMLFSFLLGFLITYLSTNDLALSEKVFIIPPIIIALYFCFRTVSFIFKSQKNPASPYKLVTLAGYIGIVFMSMMPLTVFFGHHQAVKVGLINISFLFSAFAYYKDHLYQCKMEYNTLHQIGYYSAETAFTASNISAFISDCELTAKEIEISKLILSNCCYSEIGEKLHIAEKTASKHASNIFRKTNCSCKKEFINRFS